MPTSIFSKESTKAFCELLVSYSTLREISEGFEIAGIVRDEFYQSNATGQRRFLIEQYYNSLSLADTENTRKLVVAYNYFLGKYFVKSYQRDKDIKKVLEKDGFYIDPTTIEIKSRQFNAITEVSRRNIFNALKIQRCCWYGRINEIDFLKKIFYLEKLPSTDSRFNYNENAEADIYQHRINNSDWDDDWVYEDDRLDLIKGPDELIIRFLEEIIHPIARPDQKEISSLVDLFNNYLQHDGYQFIENETISNISVYKCNSSSYGVRSTLQNIKKSVVTLNSSYINTQISRMQNSIETDPDLAIGTAKEFIETISKTILNTNNIAFSEENDDLVQLVRKSLDYLKLLPDNIDKREKGIESIKRVLGNLSNIVQGMAELRNMYGTGHGKVGKTSVIQSRHAKLVVGAAITLGSFMFDTYQERIKEY